MSCDLEMVNSFIVAVAENRENYVVSKTVGFTYPEKKKMVAFDLYWKPFS